VVRQSVPREAASPVNIPILIEPVEDRGFRATGGLPFEIRVEGATRDEALGRLRVEIERRMAGGAIVVRLELTPAQEHPWAEGAGMFQENPLFDEWQKAISEYRLKVEQEAEDERWPDGPAHRLDCTGAPMRSGHA
jgi:hypothetical protein